ncbi:MAG: LysR family transcriptional regulator [Rhodobiaceae bacterium]|nr:LysR family transcriptional regulator [Rhodobiaceae bacterium]MCC0055033.1 LysR family transcriptional regulator [Rhodobiaceae bacterium]
MSDSKENIHPFDPNQALRTKGLLETPGTLSQPIWRELHIFLSVAKNGAFARAAEELGVSQPTVARAVERLQDVVRARLLVITNQGVQLTAEGQSLARRVADLDFAIHNISTDISSTAKMPRGRVRVSITEGLAGLFGAPAMREFCAMHPEVDVDFRLPSNLIDLKENQTDLMVGFMKADSAEVTTRELGFLHFIPIATREYVDKRGLPLRSNLDCHDVIQSDYYAARTGLWEDWLKVCNKGRVRYSSDSMFSYSMLVKSGLGIGLLGSYTCIEPSAIPLDLDVHVRVPIYGVALTQRLENPAVRAMFDWLCETFAPENPWFAPDLRLSIPPGKHDEGLRFLLNL